MKINYRITLWSRSTFQNLESTMRLAISLAKECCSRGRGVCGEGRKTSSPKNACMGGYWNNWTARNFNLFHFQYDWTWQVKVTGKTKGWPINSPNAINLDIVHWQAVISSPVKLQGKCWKDVVVMLTAHLSVTLKCLTSGKHKVVSLQFIPTWWSIQLILLCWKIKVPQNISLKCVSSQISGLR